MARTNSYGQSVNLLKIMVAGGLFFGAGVLGAILYLRGKQAYFAYLTWACLWLFVLSYWWAITLPSPTSGKKIALLSHAKVCAVAALMYAEDHDRFLPPAQSWVHEVPNYFKAPVAPVKFEGRDFDIGFNAQLSGHSLEGVATENVLVTAGTARSVLSTVRSEREIATMDKHYLLGRLDGSARMVAEVPKDHPLYWEVGLKKPVDLPHAVEPNLSALQVIGKQWEFIGVAAVYIAALVSCFYGLFANTKLSHRVALANLLVLALHALLILMPML